LYAILRIPKNRAGRKNAHTMRTIILQTLAPVNKILTNFAGRKPCAARRGFLLIPLILVCFALCQQVQSAPDTPDPGPLPATNTADGQFALAGLTTGVYNSAFGIYSLLSLTDGNFCTGVGGGALLSNTADQNTATGAGALLSNTIGEENTANGTFALFNNTEGDQNTAVGVNALFSNTTGTLNTATGHSALFSNTTGDGNTAVGQSALFDNTTSDSNTAVGFLALANNTGAFNTGLGGAAGFNLTTGINNIDIGNAGVAGESVTIRIGSSQTRAFIAGIRGVTTGNNDAVNVVIDSDGQLGTMSSSRRFKKEISRWTTPAKPSWRSSR
jgi:hypothetical protein